MIRIDKRLPFGFRGEWGKVYKSYVVDEAQTIDAEQVIQWQRNYYQDIGQDVQFKHLEDGQDRRIEYGQTIKNLVERGEYRFAKTTDAYFDEEIKAYKCVVSLGDVINIGGEWYVCDKIDVHNIVTPQEQCFYYLGLKKIFDKITIGV